MARIEVVCAGEVGQFVVEESGLYLFRNAEVGYGPDEGWTVAYLMEGEEINGSIEGAGPIFFKTVD